MKSGTHVIILIFIAVGLGVVGQLALKRGMSVPAFHLPGGVLNDTLAIAKAFSRPYVFLGLVLYIVSTFFWLVVLSRAPLNMAYPMISFGYVMIVLLSALILHEKVALTTVAGMVLISGGVVLIGLGLSGPR